MKWLKQITFILFCIVAFLPSKSQVFFRTDGNVTVRVDGVNNANRAYLVVNNMEVNPSSNVLLNYDAQVNVSGNVVNNGGVFDVRTATLKLERPTAGVTDFSGATLFTNTVRDLKVGGPNNNSQTISATAGNMVRVTGFMSFDGSNHTINANGNLTLVSDNLGTASLADITNAGTTTGNVVNGNAYVERYIETNRKWRFLSINTVGAQTVQSAWMEGQPLGVVGINGRGTFITDVPGIPAGFDATSFWPSMKYWNGTGYTAITNPTTFNIKSQPTYMLFVRGDRNAQAGNATLNTTILRTFGRLDQNNTVVGTVPAGAVFRALPNPYASAVNLLNLSYSHNATINIAVWDPKLTGVYGVGGFQYLSKTPLDANFVIVPGGGSYPPAGSAVNEIESGQAFFMQGSSTPRNVQFVETAKIGKTRDVFRGTEDAGKQIIDLQLHIVENGSTELVDGIRQYVDRNFSTEPNTDDAEKMENTNENISFKYDSKLLSIDRRAPFKEVDTIHIKMANVRVKNYKWNIDCQNLAVPGTDAFLVDQHTQTRTALDLNAETSYSFNVQNIPSSYANNRFYIVFRVRDLYPPTIALEAARKQNDKIKAIVHFKVQQETFVEQYKIEKSLNGVDFAQFATKPAQQNNTGAFTLQVEDETAGNNIVYYRVKATRSNGNHITSNIAKINNWYTDAAFTIQPNPVQQIMYVYFSEQLLPINSKATLSLIDAKGANVYQTTLAGNQASNKLAINVSEMAAGTYTVVLRNTDGKTLATEMVLIKN
jgi:hypothetical protein